MNSTHQYIAKKSCQYLQSTHKTHNLGLKCTKKDPKMTKSTLKRTWRCPKGAYRERKGSKMRPSEDQMDRKGSQGSQQQTIRGLKGPKVSKLLPAGSQETSKIDQNDPKGAKKKPRYVRH